MRIWDTAHNNGVLIYLLLADRQVEIVADRGIDAKVGREGWRKICADMERDFKAGNFEAGVIKGIEAVSRQLAAYFPKHGRRPERTAGRAGGDVATTTAVILRCEPLRRASKDEAPGACGSSFEARKSAHLRMTAEHAERYAFTDGRCPTRANHAAIWLLAGSSGWPTWPPKSSQQ